jgi:predicted transposase/invertase (TIGR01784 family)
MAQEINNPHDLFLKATLNSPKAIHDFFHAHLPPTLLKKIDLNTIQLTDKSYVSSLLKEFHNDLVFSCQMDNSPSYLYLLLEHQSTPDWLLPIRFLEYNLQLLKDYVKGKKPGTKLPLIVNLCLYHGKNLEPYPYSTNIYDYFKEPTWSQEIGMFTKFLLVDLGQLSDEVLAQHGTISLMEKLLKHSRERDLFEVLSQSLDQAKTWLMGLGVDAPSLGEDYWKTILVYVANLLEAKYYSEKDLVDLFKEKLAKNEQEIMRTIANKIEQRGIQQGMQQGIQQGMYQRNLEIAKSMLKEGFAISLIAKVTNLSHENIQELVAK